MKKVKIWMTANWAGCEEEEIIEVDDDVTNTELTQMAFDFALDFIDYGHEVVIDEEEDEEDEDEL